MPQFLYNCCYGTCFELWMESSDTETLQDKTAAPYLQFQILIKVMKPLIHTKAGVVLRKICDCIGVDFSAESYDSLQRWYQTRTKKTVQGVVPRIRATIANSPGHPLYGGISGITVFIQEKISMCLEMRLECLSDHWRNGSGPVGMQFIRWCSIMLYALRSYIFISGVRKFICRTESWRRRVFKKFSPAKKQMPLYLTI